MCALESDDFSSDFASTDSCVVLGKLPNLSGPPFIRESSRRIIWDSECSVLIQCQILPVLLLKPSLSLHLDWCYCHLLPTVISSWTMAVIPFPLYASTVSALQLEWSFENTDMTTSLHCIKAFKVGFFITIKMRFRQVRDDLASDVAPCPFMCHSHPPCTVLGILIATPFLQPLLPICHKKKIVYTVGSFFSNAPHKVLPLDFLIKTWISSQL